MFGSACDCDRKLREAQNDARRYRERAAELEADREHRIEQQDREQEQFRRELERTYEEQLREANDWPEAFDKQIRLMERELASSRGLANVIFGEHPDFRTAPEADQKWWLDDIARQEADIAKVRNAREVYHAEMRAIEAEIEKIRAAARQRVIERTEDTFGMHDAMRDNDPEGWLQW